MEAKVNADFHDREAKKNFVKGDTWTGTKARFEEINESLKKNHNINAALKEVETEKKATKERKLDIETK